MLSEAVDTASRSIPSQCSLGMSLGAVLASWQRGIKYFEDAHVHLAKAKLTLAALGPFTEKVTNFGKSVEKVEGFFASRDVPTLAAAMQTMSILCTGFTEDFEDALVVCPSCNGRHRPHSYAAGCTRAPGGAPVAPPLPPPPDIPVAPPPPAPVVGDLPPRPAVIMAPGSVGGCGFLRTEGAAKTPRTAATSWSPCRRGAAHAAGHSISASTGPNAP